MLAKNRLEELVLKMLVALLEMTLEVRPEMMLEQQRIE